ncbi:Lcl domain-containing protein [Aliivibrio fischeri]|nr:DUF1566 domain-containing protein [Aliivibrio fischeri]
MESIELMLEADWTSVGQKVSLEVNGIFSEGPVELLTNAKFESSDEAIATVDTSTAKVVVVPKTLGKVTITATVDGVPPATAIIVKQFPCADGTFNCLPVITGSNGKLFTPTPEKSFVEAVGFTHSAYYKEDGSSGLIEFNAAWMNWDKVNQWCTKLNEIGHTGRTNWRMPTQYELFSLYHQHPKPNTVFDVFGWPVHHLYWSATTSGSSFYKIVGLNDSSGSANPSLEYYASCVSE